MSAAVIKLSGTPGPVDPTGEGFGLKFDDGTTVQGVKISEPDYQGRVQYKISAQQFTAGQTFALYDFKNNVSWVIDIDSASFGGNVSKYLSKGSSAYTVLEDFKADVYIKIKNNDDQIYFGLVS